MANWDSVLVDGMVVDCSTISISYAANGLATLSVTVYTKSQTPYSGNAGLDLSLGGVRFVGWVTQIALVPSSDLELAEWKVSAVGIGQKATGA